MVHQQSIVCRVVLLLGVWVSCSLSLCGQAFQTFEGGITGSVINDLAVDSAQNLLYVSGNFTQAGNTPCNCIAQWDGQTWDDMGGGAAWCGQSSVWAMTVYKGDLYAYGGFFNITDQYLARWNGSTWDSLARPDGAVSGFYEYQDTLWVLGEFTNINGIVSPQIIRFDGNNWHPFATSNNLVSNSTVTAAAFYQGDLYIGGNFRTPDFSVNDIARWDGNAFQPVGSGIRGSLSSVGRLQIYQGRLYASGLFSLADGSPGNAIIAWDGNTWDDLQGGVGGFSNPIVTDMMVFDDKLMMVGVFSSAGDADANNLAWWDGKRWCGYSDEFSSIVSDLAVYNDTLLVAGGFSQINGQPVNQLAAREVNKPPDDCGSPLSIFHAFPSAKTYKLYPNPAREELQVQSTEMGSGRVVLSVYNSVGQLVLHQAAFEVRQQSLDLDQLPPGTYWVHISDEQRPVVPLKLIKL
ncbi:MAG: T9SS type A sorting domain-containing protein [Salibacteraceae bacterium]